VNRPKLPVPLQALIDQTAPARTQQMWREIQARTRKRRRPPRGPLLLAAALMSLLAVIVWMGDAQRWFGAPAVGLRLVDGATLPGTVEPRADYAALDLSDGSRVTVARHARLDVLQTSGRAVSLALRRGRARFDVRPHGPRTWRIDCGPLAVEVVGTAFVIERGSTVLDIEVLRGAVLVRGERVPDGVQRLNGGQRLRVSTGPSQFAAAARALPVAPVNDDPTLSAAEPAPQQAAAGQDAPSRFVSARIALPEAAALRERAASSAARTVGAHSRRLAPRPLQGPVDEPAVSDVDALLREADQMRLAGRPAAAVIPLRRVIEVYPGDARAGLAAFALARLHLGALADPLQASRDLERAFSLGLPQGLQEDAYAKLVEAHERAGDRPAACAALAQYAQRFPRGTKLEAEQERCRRQQQP
jgi:transmembrane sensor